MSILSRFLQPRDHEAVAQLQLHAQGVVDGVTGGQHKSSHRGASVEFKEHRPYVKGDEIRSIDWKLYGKTDRLYIRQYEDQTNLRAMLLIDQSGSMNYRGQVSGGVSKHEFACQLAACLALMLFRQQDSVGLATFDQRLNAVIPPRRNARHLQVLLRRLAQSKPAGETGLSDVLEELAGQFKRRGLLILLSDCLDKVEPLVKALSYFRHNGSEVVVFQIWDRDELEFPFRGHTQFRSLEQAPLQQLVDPVSARRGYLERLAAFRRDLAGATAGQRIDLFECVTDEGCTPVLKAYMARRERNRRGARS